MARDNGDQQKQAQDLEKLKSWLFHDETKKRLRSVLPSDIQMEPWIEGALAMVRGNSRAAAATPASLFGAFIEGAALGLRFEPSFGQLYIETKNRKISDRVWETVAQLSVGYRGLVMLAYRSNPDLVDVEADIIYSGDAFDFQKGDKPFLRHAWDITKEDRGAPVGVYTGLRFGSGYYSFRVFGYPGLLETRVRALRHKGYVLLENGWAKKDKWKNTVEPLTDKDFAELPWFAHEQAMVMKTAIRQSARYWKLGGAFERAAQLVMMDDEGIDQNLSDLASHYVMPQREPQQPADEMRSSGVQATDARRETLKADAIAAAKAAKEKADAAGDR